MQLIKDYFKNRTIKFYIAFGTSILSLVTAIVYGASLLGLTEYASVAPLIMMIAAFAVFAVFALFRQSRIGAAGMAVINFFALVVYALTIYQYPVLEAMNAGTIANIKGMGAIIAVAVMMIITVIASNVLAWMKLDRKVESEVSVGQVKEEI